jgi:hypothetical protein
MTHPDDRMVARSIRRWVWILTMWLLAASLPLVVGCVEQPANAPMAGADASQTPPSQADKRERPANGVIADEHPRQDGGARDIQLTSLKAPGKDLDWPRFRGPNGMGTSDATGLPTTWSATENMAWKTEMPGPGASSPIVFGDQIYLTCISIGCTSNWASRTVPRPTVGTWSTNSVSNEPDRSTRPRCWPTGDCIT